MRDLKWINGSQITRSDKRMRDQRKDFQIEAVNGRSDAESASKEMGRT